MARPRKEINQETFEKLCGLQCTEDEICAWFDTTRKTVDAWCKRTYKARFSTVFDQKRGTGKISLRRKQFEVALSGNPTMLIWLGRNYLQQSETVEVRKPDDDPLNQLLARLNSEANQGKDGNTSDFE